MEVKEVLSDIAEENESDRFKTNYENGDDLENLNRFKNAENNEALNVFRLQQEDRMREIVKQ